MGKEIKGKLLQRIYGRVEDGARAYATASLIHRHCVEYLELEAEYAKALVKIELKKLGYDGDEAIIYMAM